MNILRDSYSIPDLNEGTEKSPSKIKTALLPRKNTRALISTLIILIFLVLAYSFYLVLGGFSFLEWRSYPTLWRLDIPKRALII